MGNNGTGIILLQTVLYLAQVRKSSPVKNITLQDNQLEPFFENATIKCYGTYGCFSVIFPWKDTSRPVCNFPEHPDKVSPKFCLFTRYNLQNCQVLHHNEERSIYRSFFSPFHKTYLVTHGFLETGDRSWIKNITAELLKREECNVITVDWGGGSLPPYTQAAANIRLVGRMVAILVMLLKEASGNKVENCHMIGHSLGAHLSGYVGNALREYFNESFGRITGMDPAEPHFSKTNPIVRLDSSDANFVDIIHTNIKPFIKGGLGMDEAIGHYDFYPNSGDNQPGCDHGMMKFIKKENQSAYHGLRRFLACDHIRSHEYLHESINSKCEFVGVECSSWDNFLAGHCFPCRSKQHPNGSFCANMGMPSVETFEKDDRKDKSNVILYTITNNEHPFCESLYRVTITISNSTESIEHRGEIGTFSLRIHGTNGTTSIKGFATERYYSPGSTHQGVIGGKEVGNMTHALLYFFHHTSPNPMTWRIDSKIHVGSVLIETFVDYQSIMLCPSNTEVLSSSSSMKMVACVKSSNIR